MEFTNNHTAAAPEFDHPSAHTHKEGYEQDIGCPKITLHSPMLPDLTSFYH